MSDIRAIEYAQTGESVVETATRVASDVVALLGRDSSAVRLDFAGMRGTPSSYFNVLFGQIVEAVGSQEFESRVELVFETPTQKLVATRSREAVLKAG